MPVRVAVVIAFLVGLLLGRGHVIDPFLTMKAAAYSEGVVPVAPLGSSSVETQVRLVWAVEGPSSARLAFGRATVAIAIRTNATRGYLLRVRAISLRGGAALGPNDVRVSLRAAADDVRSAGPIARSVNRTSSAGDLVYADLTVLHPVGNPTVQLVYELVPSGSQAVGGTPMGTIFLP